MLAYGFKTELVVQLVNAGLATATIEHMAVGGRRPSPPWSSGGRKTYAEARPDVVLLAKQMHDQGMSLPRYLPSLRRAATSPLAASRMSRAPCRRCSGERTPGDSSGVSRLISRAPPTAAGTRRGGPLQTAASRDRPSFLSAGIFAAPIIFCSVRKISRPMN